MYLFVDMLIFLCQFNSVIIGYKFSNWFLLPMFVILVFSNFNFLTLIILFHAFYVCVVLPIH